MSLLCVVASAWRSHYTPGTRRGSPRRAPSSLLVGRGLGRRDVLRLAVDLQDGLPSGRVVVAATREGDLHRGLEHDGVPAGARDGEPSESGRSDQLAQGLDGLLTGIASSVAHVLEAEPGEGPGL